MRLVDRTSYEGDSLIVEKCISYARLSTILTSPSRIQSFVSFSAENLLSDYSLHEDVIHRLLARKDFEIKIKVLPKANNRLLIKG